MNSEYDMVPLKNAEDIVWQAVNILRGNTSSDDFFIILFLLTMVREGVIDENHDLYLSAQIQKKINLIDEGNPKKEYLSKISIQFESSVDKLTGIQIEELLRLLTSIGSDVYENHFGQLFNFLLYELTKSQGRFGGEYILPKEVAIFISSLVSLEESSKIYNPFSGLASFITFQEGNHQFYGQEINSKTWAIGAMRLLASGKYLNTNYDLTDSILNWNNYDLKYDLVISNPPFRMRMDEAHESEFGKTRYVENFFIEKGIESLNDEGKLVAIIPNSFLSNPLYEENLRKHLVDNDLLESVISLPGGLLYNIGIPITILVINKIKNKKGLVRLVDGTSFVEKDRKTSVLKYSTLLGIIHT